MNMPDLRSVAARVAALAMLALLALPANAQQVIYLMRHAEPMRSPDQPADPNPVLSEAGHRRAAVLAHRLKSAGIGAIYVTDTRRTQQTAEPTARALGLVPKVVGRQDIEGLVSQVRTEHPKDRVLIVNHALNVAGLLKSMGHTESLAVAIDDFEPMIVVVPRPEGPPLVLHLRF